MSIAVSFFTVELKTLKKIKTKEYVRRKLTCVCFQEDVLCFSK